MSDNKIDGGNKIRGAGDAAKSGLSMKAGLGGLLVVGALLAVAAWFFFLKDDAPAAPTLEGAMSEISDEEGDADEGDEGAAATATTEAEGDTAEGDATETPEATTTAAGTWSVDNTIGDIAEESSSFVGFRIDEELSAIGDFTAVGRTPDVTGEIVFEGTQLTAATFEAQMGTLATDDSRRDGQVYRALDTEQFPTGVFTLTEPVELGSEPEEGTTIAIEATGDLTVHGVTKTVTIPLDAQLSGGVIGVVGLVDFLLSDFDVEAPSAPIVVSVSDTATMEVQLFFTQS